MRSGERFLYDACGSSFFNNPSFGFRSLVFHFDKLGDACGLIIAIWLLITYAKANLDNLPAGFLAKLKHEVEHG